MTFLVIAYPKFQQSDFDWIQEYRSQHDNQFSLVKPHFSIVFGVHNMDRASFLKEVRQQVKDVKMFDVDMRVATMTQYHDGSHYQEFLIPDTGYSNIVKLHDQLYSGLFKPYLRFDITYIPHIAIGYSEDPYASKKRIDELNEGSGIAIHGHINGVDIIEHVDGTVSTIETITLQEPKG